MGRGRQKAKHTKVARELKYFSPDTNYSALERELAGLSAPGSEYDSWADKYNDLDGDDHEDDEEPAQRFA